MLSPRFALFAGAACISLSPILTKLTGVPGLASAFYRVAIAFIIFLPYIVYKQYFRIEISKAAKAMACGVLFSLDIACWNQSLMISDTSLATVLGNMAPVWTGFLLWMATKQRPTPMYWAGVALALSGLVFMLGWDKIRHLDFSYGSLLALAASGFYASYMVATGLVRSGIPTMTFMFYSMLGNLMTSGIIALMMGTPLSGFDNTGWFYLLLLAIIPQLAGWIFVNNALGHLPSTEVAITLLSQIPIAAVMGAYIFNEQISFNQVIGSLLILMGIVFTYKR